MTRALALAAALCSCAPAPAPVPCRPPRHPMMITWDGVEIGDTAISCAPEGRPVPVVWDATIQGLARATLDPPLIRLRPDLQAQPRAVQVIAALHECAHITLRTADERAAGCWAATTAELRHHLDAAGWRELEEALPRIDGGAEQLEALRACRGDAL